VPSSRRRPTDWLAEELYWYALLGSGGAAVFLFVAIWSLTGNIAIAIVATPVLIATLWWGGSRFVRWFRSI